MVNALPGDGQFALGLPVFPQAQVGWLFGRRRRERAAAARAEASAEVVAGDEETLDEGTRLRLHDLRRRTGEQLVALAGGVEQRLPEALRQAEEAWYQTGATVLVDENQLTELNELRFELEAIEAAGAKAQAGVRARALAAVATEALLVLRVAFGLVTLTESRLAPVIRLRVRMEDRRLLPDERPFLDLGPALIELARRWL